MARAGLEMRSLLIASAALLLASCATDGQFQTSTSVNGYSFQSKNLADPHFYMGDERASPAPSPAMIQPIPRYGIDSYCGYCQGRGGWRY